MSGSPIGRRRRREGPRGGVGGRALPRQTVPLTGPTEIGFDDAARLVATVIGKRRPFVRAPIAFHYLMARLAERLMTVLSSPLPRCESSRRRSSSRRARLTVCRTTSSPRRPRRRLDPLGTAPPGPFGSTTYGRSPSDEADSAWWRRSSSLRPPTTYAPPTCMIPTLNDQHLTPTRGAASARAHPARHPDPRRGPSTGGPGPIVPQAQTPRRLRRRHPTSSRARVAWSQLSGACSDNTHSNTCCSLVGPGSDHPLLATSPGPHGAQLSLETSVDDSSDY